MKYKNIAFLIIIVIFTGLYGYINHMNSTIKIGFAGGLSGQWSQLSIEARNGFLLAIKDINADGGLLGKEVVPVFYDDRNDPEYAKSFAEQFKKDEVQIVVGFCVSQLKPAVEHILDNTNILFISPTMSTYELSNIDDNFIRVVSDSTFQGNAIVEDLKINGTKNTVVIYDLNNSGYTVPLSKYINDKAALNNIKIADMIGIDSTNIDTDSFIMRVKESRPEGIVFITSAIDTAKLAQLLKINNIDGTFYSSTWARTNDLIANGGTAIEGLIIPGYFDEFNTSDTYRIFKDKLYDEFGTKPTFSSMYGYETMIALFNGITVANSTDPNKVKEAIIQINTFKGIQGNFQINEYGDTLRNTIKFKIKDGEYIRLD